MLGWIYDLPDSAIIALLLVGVAGPTAAALVAMQYVARPHPLREREGAILDMPFRGESAVQPTELQRVLNDLGP